MATFNLQGISPISFTAGGTIGINRAVKLDSTAGQVVVTSAITDVCVGVAIQSGTSGTLVAVQTSGVAKMVASDAIALNAQVMPTASGSGKVVTAAGATAKSLGVALQASGADGDVIEVLLHSGPNVNGVANS